ncbi:MAG TPA: hypothetical protein VJA16_15230 [Thermoanaerobaculia bacterium]
MLGAFLDPRAGAGQAPGTGTSGASGTSDAPGVAAVARGVSRIEINGGMPLFSEAPEVTVAGSTDAPAGSTVEVSIEAPAPPAAPPPAPALPPAATVPPGAATSSGAAVAAAAEVTADGRWSLRWPVPLAAGTYAVRATVRAPGGASASTLADLVVQLPGRFPRRPLLSVPESYASPVQSAAGDFQEFTDRWRVVLPPYELTVPGSRFDPYDQNRWKGDLPIRGQDLFLNLSAVADTLVEPRQLPTPSGVGSARPGSLQFFGRDGQLLATETIALSADLFKGDTAFRPIDWRIKASIVADVNYLRVAENGIVNPDVRQGTSRTDGFVAVQELFGELKLADLSPNYDFVSVRAGIQPFNSDFRGFVFTDTNLGARLFGSYQSNRDQFNLAFFDRLEKDTNSGLNTFDARHQQVAVANVYRQDFLVPGYTAQASLHYLRDEPSFHFDTNGFLVRPDPVGSFTPHEVRALYLGWTGLGHFGRINVDHAFYFATGTDSLNPIAGPDPAFGAHDQVNILAGMAALEVSVDRDWWRPRIAYLYSSGDRNPTDRTANGFDSILDNPAFAGGGFSFWNRFGILLPGTGVALVNRGSLIPDLRSSKDEGQPNFVNPGLRLLSGGVDLDLTPKLRLSATANYLRFDHTEVLELLLFQSPIHTHIGWDLSLGARYRPLLSNNIVLLAGVATLLPGTGFKDIFGPDRGPLVGTFADLVLSF